MRILQLPALFEVIQCQLNVIQTHLCSMSVKNQCWNLMLCDFQNFMSLSRENFTQCYTCCISPYFIYTRHTAILSSMFQSCLQHAACSSDREFLMKIAPKPGGAKNQCQRDAKIRINLSMSKCELLTM